MKHASEDDLVLYFYGEHRRPSAVEAHLDACADCRATYGEIAETLGALSVPSDGADIPARDERYGLEVWQRIRHELAAHEPAWWNVWLSLARLEVAAPLVALLVAAFLIGFGWRGPARSPETATEPADSTGDRVERARLAATADHFERSERVLLDLLNAEGDAVDVSAQQAWAADLVDASRLFRDAAAEAGDSAIAQVLDDLERNLLEIAHGPSELTSTDLERVRVRLDAAALLFKVRFLANELTDELQGRATAAFKPRNTT
jgi:hypothetical protein